MSRQTVFLDRRRYRKRRALDALRILPVLGVVLFLAPLLWTSAASEPPEGGGSTAFTGAYLFGIWALLIVAAAGLSRVFGSDPGGRDGATGAIDKPGAGPGSEPGAGPT